MKRNRVDIRPAVEPVDRPVDPCAQRWVLSIAQSTGVHKRAQDISVDRPVDRRRRTVDRLT